MVYEWDKDNTNRRGKIGEEKCNANTGVENL